MDQPFGRRKMIAALILAIVAMPVFFLSVRAFSAWRAGYSWAEMDWDGKGRTTIVDFLKAAEIGKRPILVNGQQCFEYYLHRDRLVVKTVCPP
ncbi:hypothetical protein LG047_10020 [Methylocystis sp. WRRC1]|uniref:hypothetical protein n=1 Tax=Methylocystis sp. WRRC1 TaxID=1732014 RepID=UPI001D145268|nr:hypothetical protein [Methylocystis sp. WRRC1]MCC3245656.1 hypothetical protein [Methylocystis sp. WRRC1]